MIKRVNIIGAGNVAYYFCEQLQSKVDIVTIFSQHLENSNAISQKYKSVGVNDLSRLSADVDLNIVCVKDDVLTTILKKLDKKIPVVHTSGSRGIDLMKDFETCGIFYPLQTISKNRAQEKISVPFLIEANSTKFGEALMQFCRTYFSSDAIFANSETRAQIHLAAVFANNFTNFLLSVSKDILDKKQIDFKILEPLMKETINKAFQTNPNDAQTGPAKRKDVELMDDQLRRIESEELKELYKLISKLIAKKSTL